MSLYRPGRLVVVVGTGTEIGKTWVSCRLLEAARAREIPVAARKPLQSYAPDDPWTDAFLLGVASGERTAAVCPPQRSYPVPMAPPMAAAALGVACPTLAELLAEIEASWPTRPKAELGLVETAGGVASPLTRDADGAMLVRRLRPDAVLLVADPALGAINSVRLCAAALHPYVPVVHLNRFDPDDDIQQRNADWLAHKDGFRVVTEVPACLDLLMSP